MMEGLLDGVHGETPFLNAVTLDIGPQTQERICSRYYSFSGHVQSCPCDTYNK